MYILKEIKKERNRNQKFVQMGPSPAKPGIEPSPGPVEGVYYGVYLPPDVLPSREDTEGSAFFTDKSEALKLVKKYKKARFKSFRTMTDAIHFSAFGMDIMSVEPTVCPMPPAESGEKPSPFRGPKPQDMVRFRKAIEAGDLDFVKKTVWENPRFLVSSGDTPAILQEGSRYNGLHVAARSRNATICAYILQTVNSREFMHHFYGDSTDVDQRCSVLLDLYLNTPDKALNETPLHFATKFGAAQVVRVLVAYPQCDREATNKFHQTAKDVVCSRLAGADSALKEEITSMLSEQFYVPVLRSPDYSFEPVVGQPFSPTSPLQEQRSCVDALSPVLEVQAVAGPMPRQTAELFRRRWKTPPRVPGSPLHLRRPTLTDHDKGWEKVGRELAQEWKVAWKEFWPFLDKYTDLNSLEGLQLLEDYLHKRFKNTIESPDCTSMATSIVDLQPPTPPTNGLESPVTELCSALRACRLSSGGTKPAPRHPPPSHLHQSLHNGDVKHTTAPDVSILVHVTSPHLYMEKSCQVFAKRIADGLQMCEELDFLGTEVRHLNGLVTSCQSDSRFSQLEFCRLHSHLGHLVAARLDPADLSRILVCLRSFVKRRSEGCGSSDEDEVLDSPYSRRPRTDRRDLLALQSSVICLAQAILTAAEHTPTAAEQTPTAAPQSTPTSEAAYVEAWAQAAPCSCTFLTHRHARRKFSQKKLNFNDAELDGVSTENIEKAGGGGGEGVAKCSSTPADSSGEESDTSDTSECEFFTPPSSPGVRSDDDQAMESPDEGPDVYINGSSPSKLDMSVLEAIRDSEISRAKYPNICRWRHLVLLHSDHERQSWMSSPKHRLPSGTSPLWHRAPSLNFK